jgi:hypothetical protein
MATLNEVMKDTAEAIREKTGKSELIKPVDFASEIKGITSGGEGGGSTFEYLDITNVTGAGSQLKYLLLQMAYMCKIPQAFKLNDKTFMQSIGPAGGPMSMAGAFAPGSEEADTVLNGITAVSINFSDTINMQGQVLTIGEVLAMYVEQEYIDAIPRITKEQFYDLNA